MLAELDWPGGHGAGAHLRRITRATITGFMVGDEKGDDVFVDTMFRTFADALNQCKLFGCCFVVYAKTREAGWCMALTPCEYGDGPSISATPGAGHGVQISRGTTTQENSRSRVVMSKPEIRYRT